MQAGIYRQAGLQLHNQIYFELIAFELCSSKAIFLSECAFVVAYCIPRNIQPALLQANSYLAV